MKKIISLLIVGTILTGCAGKGGTEIEPDKTLAEIYQSAYVELEDKSYETAATQFLQAESQFPSSPWAADALIMAAYSQYMDKDFAGAIMTTDRFMRFHPGHKDVAYVLYLRGMCYYRQVSDVRREPGMSAYAMQQFQQLVDRFPKSPYAENAKNKINILKEKDRKIIITREVSYELLSPEGTSNIEFIRMILNEKGLESSIEPMSHKGEEVAFLLSGKAEITISNKSAIMYPGDSIHIPALTPHKWKNLYDEESVIIFAVTPPEF